MRRLVVGVLEPMRREFGVCVVHSGCRTLQWNARVGGARRSYHVYRLREASAAADVSFQRGTPDDWARRARAILGERGGVGVYDGHVHVDDRPTRADWRG